MKLNRGVNLGGYKSGYSIPASALKSAVLAVKQKLSKH